MGIMMNDSMHQALAVVNSLHDEVLISEEQPRNSNDEERKMKFERGARGQEADGRQIRKNIEGDRAWEEEEGKHKLETTIASQQSHKGHTPQSTPVCTMVGHNRGKESAAASSKTKRSKQSHCERANGGGSIVSSCKRIRVADPPHTSDKATTAVLRPVKKPLKARKLCEHQQQKRDCEDCGGSGICKHQRRRRRYKACGGSEICKHQQQRSECRACNGGKICEHQRMRSRCKACREVQSKATEIGKGQARKQEI